MLFSYGSVKRLAGLFYDSLRAGREDLTVVVLEIGLNIPPSFYYPARHRKDICILYFYKECWAYIEIRRALAVVASFLDFNIPPFEIMYASFLPWSISVIFPSLLAFWLSFVQVPGVAYWKILTPNLLTTNSFVWAQFVVIVRKTVCKFVWSLVDL